MKYIGNKTRLLPFIDQVMAELDIEPGRALDPFCGTASVARHLKSRGWSVVAGDIQRYAFVQALSHVQVTEPPDFGNIDCGGPGAAGLQQALDRLNELDGEEGFFYRNYAPGGSDGARQYFSDENALRIDGVRRCIREWRESGALGPEAHAVLLASLINAADFVANMSGTYGAFLKIWRSMALKPLTLRPIEILFSPVPQRAVLSDAVDLVRQEPCDLLYLDPPYTNRQYATNFHILETLAEEDEPELRGKTGLRPTADQLSDFARRRRAAHAMASLLQGAQARWVLLSYSDEGLISHAVLLELLSTLGEPRVFEQVYRRFRTERDHAGRRYKRPDDRVVERLYAVRTHQSME